ncbi:hypothetical protein BCP8-2_001 [Bacillus phage BCP8-2]|uniref:Uncharacterized protein n=1 Tax=Bacillus phage BCP8-2 TaxID=1129192 RepID=A0A0E3D981_9CAUD|nr:hypothetical protein BCP8-2_001 [Bacillus phage BCP8-2]AHJ87039.1 hypothetical protein BCP8-2_001 [Bacillus phage BCP8-2]
MLSKFTVAFVATKFGGAPVMVNGVPLASYDPPTCLRWNLAEVIEFLDVVPIVKGEYDPLN